jgi:hypothetical protein
VIPLRVHSGFTDAAEVRRRGWLDLVSICETKDGREVRMPEWVCDYACTNVDGSDGAAIRKDPDGWRLCNCYLFLDDLDDDVHADIAEAQRAADAYNEARGLVPFVVPSTWAILSLDDAP